MADDLKRVGLTFKADGTVDFKKTLAEVNAAVKENYSSFRLAQSQWDKSTTSQEKLKAKNTTKESPETLLIIQTVSGLLFIKIPPSQRGSGHYFATVLSSFSAVCSAFSCHTSARFAYARLLSLSRLYFEILPHFSA